MIRRSCQILKDKIRSAILSDKKVEHFGPKKVLIKSNEKKRENILKFENIKNLFTST